jgi:D-alanyl-D-alanine carboxypeptidase (penicillin-binding protein 5/6)
VVANRNNLIAAHPWVSGVKTGYTLQAGNLLVGSAEGRGGARVISVVMGEPSEAARDADTLALLKWGLDRFHRVRVVARNRRLARASVKYRDEPVALLAARPLTVTLRDGQQIRRELSVRGELEGPLPAGSRAGQVNVLVDGRSVGRVPLVTARELPKVGAATVVLKELGLPLTTAILLAILLLAVIAAQRVRVRLSRR